MPGCGVGEGLEEVVEKGSSGGETKAEWLSVVRRNSLRRIEGHCRKAGRALWSKLWKPPPSST